MTDVSKMILVPIDDSTLSLRSLDYIQLLFGTRHHLDVELFHVAPVTPAHLMKDAAMPAETVQRIRQANKKSVAKAQKILQYARKNLLDRGFDQERVHALTKERKRGTAEDIVEQVEACQADAVLIATLGRTRLEAFFIGETAVKVMESSPIAPVWLLKGTVTKRGVLVAMDASDGALRGVDHAGFLLAGTDCPVTLFYSKRHFWRFVPRETADETPGLQTYWEEEAGRQIAPFMERAREMLLDAGIAEELITMRIVEGCRNTAADILKAAEECNCGSVVLGHRGLSGIKAYALGSVSRKVLENAMDLALWMVP